MEHTILIVEDDPNINEILGYIFQKEKYRVLSALDGEEGLRLALEGSPDIVLLDVMLPELNGFEVLRRLREKSQVPVIILTARDDEVDAVMGLNLGADDYVVKPYKKAELIARVNANLRRIDSPKPVPPPSVPSAPVTEPNRIRFGDFVVNTENYTVTKNGNVVRIIEREYNLLKFLLMRPKKLFTREQLLMDVWKYGAEDAKNETKQKVVNVSVALLRKNIEDDPKHPKYIITKSGVGYYFAGEVEYS